MRGTLKHRRGKKEMKQDRDDHFADLAEHEPTENAKKSILTPTKTKFVHWQLG